jgi:hypothetical protein
MFLTIFSMEINHWWCKLYFYIVVKKKEFVYYFLNIKFHELKFCHARQILDKLKFEILYFSLKFTNILF